MALRTGAAQTYYANADSVLVRFVGDEIAEYDKDITPLTVMSIKAGRKKSAYTPKLEVIEDSPRGAWVSHNASAIDSVNTTVVVNDGTLVNVYDLLAVAKADSSSAAEEVIHVTAKSNNTLTVTRGIGGAGADTISATQALLVIGAAYPEGAAYGAQRITSKAIAVSYCQIFREPIQITGTQMATKTYGGTSEATHQEQKALRQWKVQLEKAAFWSRASESLVENATLRTTMGFKSRVSTNVTDGGTTVTWKKFAAFGQTAFRYNANPKLFVAAPVVISAISSFAVNNLFVRNDESVYGVRLTRLRLPHGDLMLSNNFLMEDGISGQAGFDDEAYAIDLGAVELYFLSANGVSRDVSLLRNVVKAGADKSQHEFLGECGWLFPSEKRHARLYGASDYA